MKRGDVNMSVAGGDMNHINTAVGTDVSTVRTRQLITVMCPESEHRCAVGIEYLDRVVAIISSNDAAVGTYGNAPQIAKLPRFAPQITNAKTMRAVGIEYRDVVAKAGTCP